MPQHPDGMLKGTFESFAVSMLAFAYFAEDVTENLFPEQIEEQFGCKNTQEILTEYINQAAHFASENSREEILRLINFFYQDV